MKMRDDFCVFILTHGRPDRVYTYRELKRWGYTGKVYLVVDDEDSTLPEYIKQFGEESVLVFSKEEVAKKIDTASNRRDWGVILFARCVCFDLAEKVGVKYFVQFDDDYTSFFYRYNSKLDYGQWRLRSTFDELFNAMLDFYEGAPQISSLAISQGGDHIGGNPDNRPPRAKRKAMNSFLCSVERPFEFAGRINEDVNVYTEGGRRGELFLTTMSAQLNQRATQSNAGGMTETYLDGGTYVKSFYSVMYAPSCVSVGTLQDPRSPHMRIHHRINWDNAAPKILHERWKKE